MRVVVAPDTYRGTLKAAQAAAAISQGWRAQAPADDLVLAPVADGGPGFVEVLHQALGGRTYTAQVLGPYGEFVSAQWLLVGEVAYLESAQACGLALTQRREPLIASSVGVGQLVITALEAGASRIVIGLGGSATNDGGAGLLYALGATGDRRLDAGSAALAGIGDFDVEPARKRVDGIDITIASDVTTPLLGLFGASKTFGPQKGLSESQIIEVDAILDAYVNEVCGPRPSQRAIADAAGAGAAGGLGFALLALGGEVVSGIGLVANAVNLRDLAAQADLVVTGEGCYDFTSRAGKVVYAVAQIAQEVARPCVVLAGQVQVGTREMRAMGVESGYAVADLVGNQAAFEQPFESLTRLAARVARTWSRGPLT